MKKLVLLVTVTIAMLCAGCSKEDSPKGKTYCWEFNTTQVTSVSGVSVPGYPKTVKSKTSKCDLTEAQAEEVVKGITNTTTATEGGIKVTIKTTCVKTRK